MSQHFSLGVIDHKDSNRRTDYLYRISIKGLIQNDKGEVLVVKESGRGWWDFPGGGMDHSESITTAIARELKEEVSLEGNFTYQIIAVDEPDYLEAHDFWQIRLIFKVVPETMEFSVGEDSDEIAFMDPEKFRSSTSEAERRVYTYANIALRM